MSLFSGIKQPEIVSFLQNGSLFTLSRNDQLLRHNDNATHFYVIIDGWVKLFRDSFDGAEAVLDIVGAGSFFGEITEEEQAKTQYSAQIVSRSAIVLAIPLSTLRSKIENNGKLGYRILSGLVDQNNQLHEQIEKLSVMNAEQRVVSYLMKLKRHNKDNVDLPYSKSLAAMHLGMKPETFSRVLKQIQKYGISTKGGSVSFQKENAVNEFVYHNENEVFERVVNQ